MLRLTGKQQNRLFGASSSEELSDTELPEVPYVPDESFNLETSAGASCCSWCGGASIRT